MGDELRVEPDALSSAGNAYKEAGSALTALQPADPLNTAADGVPGLRTASACRTAGSALAQQTAGVAKDATGYGSDLGAAAAEYRDTDDTAATAVDGAMPGG